MPGLLILAKQRTGTNWLRSLLAGASTLQDLDEVFHTDTTLVPHSALPLPGRGPNPPPAPTPAGHQRTRRCRRGPQNHMLAGGSQAAVVIGPGTESSRISTSSEVPNSLWRMPPGIRMASPASQRVRVPSSNSRSTQPFRT